MLAAQLPNQMEGQECTAQTQRPRLRSVSTTSAHEEGGLQLAGTIQTADRTARAAIDGEFAGPVLPNEQSMHHPIPRFQYAVPKSEVEYLMQPHRMMTSALGLPLPYAPHAQVFQCRSCGRIGMCAH